MNTVSPAIYVAEDILNMAHTSLSLMSFPLPVVSLASAPGGPEDLSAQWAASPLQIQLNLIFTDTLYNATLVINCHVLAPIQTTVKILKFGTPQTIAIIILKLEKFDVTLH